LGRYKGAVKVSLPKARYVYDLKRQLPVEQSRVFTTNLRPSRASFFALLPSPAPEPLLTLPASSLEAGAALKASVSIPNAAGKHPVILRLVTPAGAQAGWFAEALIVGTEPVAFTLAFAHNDPPGEWQIQATDLLGKKTTSEKLILGRSSG
jgi:hypothetical protein